MILSSSSGKNTTLLGALPIYETRNDRSEIFQDLVTCISFVRLCQMAYNKITYSMGSMNMNNKRTEVAGVWNWVTCSGSWKIPNQGFSWLVAQPAKSSKQRRLDSEGEQINGVRNEVWSSLMEERTSHPDILQFILDFQEVRVFTPILWAWGLAPFSEPIMCYNWHYYVSTISPNLKTVNSVLNEKISSTNSVQSSLPFLSCPANLLYGNFWFSHSDYDVLTVAEMF